MNRLFEVPRGATIAELAEKFPPKKGKKKPTTKK
jgi:hypothetical protein